MTLSSNLLKNGIIKLPKTNIEFKTKQTNIKQVRLIPRNNYIILEIIYEIQEEKLKSNNKRYMSIDLGINNLATCVSNVTNSFIINGKPIKSINQFYNNIMQINFLCFYLVFLVFPVSLLAALVLPVLLLAFLVL